MTLEETVVYLRRAFAEGQVYVALSRVRRLQDLSLDIVPSDESVRQNADVSRFYDLLVRADADRLAAAAFALARHPRLGGRSPVRSLPPHAVRAIVSEWDWPSRYA
jgi:hypothetical protein